MSSFTVDPNTMEALRASIVELYLELAGVAHRSTPSYHGVLGGGSLEGEVGSFMDAWRGGLKVIAHDMANVSESLYTAAENYRSSDGYVGGACLAGPGPAFFRSAS